MSLKTYRQKRSFKKTPEPTGVSQKKNKGPLSFVIHEHHATHLHWDLRLELDGVLKSWAVPKGPPLRAHERRLAIAVEDHPFEYGKFEGKIPQGHYGAGTVKIWDKGFYSSPQTADRKESSKILREEYEKGRMHILMAGERLKGLYTLVRTKDNQWLWMLKTPPQEKSSTNKFKLFRKQGTKTSINSARAITTEAAQKPMLSVLYDKPFSNPDWLFEFKWDGYRAVAHTGDKPQLYSRNQLDFSKKFPPVFEALKEITHDAVIDGEIIALNEKGKIEFQLLQDYGEHPVPLKYAVFDLLFLNGEDLRERPLIERKRLLKKIIPKDSKVLMYSEHVEGEGIKFFKTIEKEGWEGMMAKNKNSTYEERRSDNWRKIKSTKRQEAVIAGYTQPRGSRGHFGALILGIYQNGSLKYIGHTGTGFNELSLKDTYERMEKLETAKSPFAEEPKTNMPVTWIKPQLVCEVKFTEWTREGSLRHPVFMGLREDKPAKEVVIEEEQSEPDPELPDLKPATKSNETSECKTPSEGDELKFTNLDKIYWPYEKFTKGDVIDYYEKIAPYILTHLKDRPLSLLRHPNGIREKGFFQKNITNAVPSFVQTCMVDSESRGKINYMVCQNKETLLYAANLGCIEMNPWNSRVGSLDNPDIMIIDLDPQGRPFVDLVTVAQASKDVLDMACEASFIKTSGKRGLHILVPLGAQYTYDQIRTFCGLLVRLIHQRVPDLTSLERSPSKRITKIYLDHLQNSRGQTLACAYSLRPWPGATVSTPLEWKEVKKGLDPAKFNIKTIIKRIKDKGDLWKDLHKKPVDLLESIKCLRAAQK